MLTIPPILNLTTQKLVKCTFLLPDNIGKTRRHLDTFQLLLEAFQKGFQVIQIHPELSCLNSLFLLRELLDKYSKVFLARMWYTHSLRCLLVNVPLVLTRRWKCAPKTSRLRNLGIASSNLPFSPVLETSSDPANGHFTYLSIFYFIVYFRTHQSRFITFVHSFY